MVIMMMSWVALILEVLWTRKLKFPPTLTNATEQALSTVHLYTDQSSSQPPVSGLPGLYICTLTSLPAGRLSVAFQDP